MKWKRFAQGFATGTVIGLCLSLFLSVVTIVAIDPHGGFTSLLADAGGLIVAGANEATYKGEAIPFRHLGDNQRQASEKIRKALASSTPPTSMSGSAKWFLGVGSVITLLFGVLVGIESVKKECPAKRGPHSSTDPYVFLNMAARYVAAGQREKAIDQLDKAAAILGDELPRLVHADQRFESVSRDKAFGRFFLQNETDGEPGH